MPVSPLFPIPGSPYYQWVFNQHWVTHTGIKNSHHSSLITHYSSLITHPSSLLPPPIHPSIYAIDLSSFPYLKISTFGRGQVVHLILTRSPGRTDRIFFILPSVENDPKSTDILHIRRNEKQHLSRPWHLYMPCLSAPTRVAHYLTQ